jgi:ferrous iron transport protein B
MSLKIALAGNPNSGKTTLFNALTGSTQYVGNWPGVTVEKKEGRLRKSKDDVTIVDLPGIYSLSPYTLEEVIARDYILKEKPDVIINIVDASNLERNLYLTTQMMELGIPVVVALNMIDVVQKRGDIIDDVTLEKKLGCPVMPISALKSAGLDALISKATTLGERKPTPLAFSGAVEKSLAQISEAVSAEKALAEYNRRWLAIKLFERDSDLLKKTNLPESLKAKVDTAITAAETALDDDAETIITNERYDCVAPLLTDAYKKRSRPKLSTSDKIDRIMTNRILALPLFVVVMFCVYYISVTSLGTIVTDWTNDTLFGEWIQPGVSAWLTSIGAADWLNSLVVGGIIGGLAAPIGFAPQMAILFFFLSILEDCGYMARIAFIMDRIFRRFGLSGKSFIPLLISTGCGVPGIMSTKTIENEKDRRITIMTTTFVPCGAKLPVIALIAGAIMGGAWWMAPTMYFIGILAVIVSGVILKKTRWFSGKPAPFVMELPQYHLPSVRNVLLQVWERVWSFLKKAGTILFLACIVMWFLGSFGVADGQFGLVDAEYSLLAVIGGFIAPIFIPLGFGTWQAVASSLSGFVAKEGIVTTMAILVGLGSAGEGDVNLWAAVMGMFPSAIGAFTFLMFNLLDSPCLAAISTMAKEMNSRKWTAFALVYQNLFAYWITLMVYQFGTLIAGGSFGVGTAVAIVLAAAFLFLLFRPSKKKNNLNTLASAKAGM